ncbi:AIG_G0016490.mRNA.1.CDS.1 [Saccharomyces cerevisiae]|nr:AIG_G0016490.mRNA.1.CDS.1 [Saccharomyces cerevisiae]CAI6641165.1 AIG_G0016490.mRNA.1.CDS.1 [Saccharomyces cerevisiae]
MHSHHYARRLPQRSIPLCHLPITPHDYPHFNIYILFGGPKYCINALDTYVIPLFSPYTNHSIYIHLFQYYRKITTKIT